MNTRTSIIILLFAASITHGQITHAQILTADISSWNYSHAWLLSPGSCSNDLSSNSQSYEHSSGMRMWGRRRLKDALSVKNHNQLWPLIKRLSHRQSINVLILGDSIVDHFAGRYPSGTPRVGPFNFVHDTMDIQGDEQQQAHAECADTNLAWGRSFMSLINQSYPHTGHQMFNLGISAANFKGHRMMASCGSLFPKRIDLLVLEHLPQLEHPESAGLDAELLLHVLWGHMQAPLPAVLFMNMYRTPGGIGDHLEANAVDADTQRRGRMRKCVTSYNSLSECSKCDGLFETLPEGVHEAELATNKVASHYSMASWSHRTFIEGLIRDGIPLKFNLSACEFFATLYTDGTHPRELQQILFADVLYDFVQTAVELFGNEIKRPPAGLANISTPLHQQSDTVPTARCFNALAKERKLPGPGAYHMTPLNVTLADGWSLTETDGGRYRPGWIGERVQTQGLPPPPSVPSCHG